jgi:hypothetical protein
VAPGVSSEGTMRAAIASSPSASAGVSVVNGLSSCRASEAS